MAFASGLSIKSGWSAKMQAANSKSDHANALAMHRALDTSRDIGPISKARSSCPVGLAVRAGLARLARDKTPR
jgi:hypothetical protein